MSRPLELVGRRFSRLTVLSRTDHHRIKVYWRCRCACGGFCVVSTTDLRSGHTRSCGCLHDETVTARNLRHGHAKRTQQAGEYLAWKNMKQRCYNAKRPDYSYYGGRGIRVCDAWRHDFSAFLSNMGPKPFERATVDRINVNGNYEPANCRWASRLQQTHNRRRSK